MYSSTRAAARPTKPSQSTEMEADLTAKRPDPGGLLPSRPSVLGSTTSCAAGAMASISDRSLRLTP